MSSVAVPAPARRRGVPLSLGVTTGYLSVIVLIPLAAVVLRSMEGGAGAFWDAVTDPQAVAALRLTFLVSLGVVAINAVAGTVIAWVLVRDSFRGKSVVNAIIDLPFALPTIVAGLTLLALYGPRSPIGVNVAYTVTALVVALLFVTLPFVVRTVQPVLLELDRGDGGGCAITRRDVVPDVPAGRLPEPVPGHSLRHRARVCARTR